MCFFAVVSAEGLIVSGAALVAESTEDAAGASLLLLLQAIAAPATIKKRMNNFCIKFRLWFPGRNILFISCGRKALAAHL